VLLVILLVLPMAATAASGLPPRPDPPLPDPPQPAPSPTPAPRHSSGAHIRLSVTPGIAGEAAPTVIWTVVQWQDSAGFWHTVDGWCGHLDGAPARTKTWWVSAADLGRGPFRWAIFHGKDGPVLATSAPFDLPSGTGQMLDVDVTLP